MILYLTKFSLQRLYSVNCYMATIDKSLFLATKSRKKITLQDISEYVNVFKNGKINLSLQQKYAILPSLANLLHIYSLNFSIECEKLRNVFYCVKVDREERTKAKGRQSYGVATTKKEIIEMGNNQVSMQEILNQAISGDKNKINILSLDQTIRKEPIMENIQLEVTIEPFDPNVIEQISQDMSSSSKNVQIDQIPNIQKMKLEEYKKWLELSQKGPMLQTTSRKKQQTTLKKLGKVKAKLDEIIEVGEQPVNRSDQIFFLATKVKENCKKYIGIMSYISHQMNKLNPILISKFDLGRLRQNFIQKRKQKDIQGEKTRNLNENENDFFANKSFNSQSPNIHRSHIERSLFLIENSDPTTTRQLQAQIKYLLNQKLQLVFEVSFSDFCYEKKISKEVKGELFYQLLNLDFILKQENPSNFSDIKIGLDLIQ